MQKEFEKEWNEICKTEKEMATKKRKMEDEMVTKKQTIMEEIMKGMMEKDAKIAKMDIENRVMKIKMSKMETELKMRNITIRSLKLPAELLNEFFGSMPLKNSFGLLTKMSNGLLARNVQKMLKSIKEEMKNNKLNEEDCGSKLVISEEGIVLNHSGPWGWNCVRTALPIPSFNANVIKSIISFYFELQILNKSNGRFPIRIGFCGRQFSLENIGVGKQKNSNSIGIASKSGMRIDGLWIKFKNYGNFEKNDIIGIGLIHQPNAKMECFTTWNGNLLEKTELPSKFAKIELFPAINLWNADDSIRVNFGKNKWHFKDFKIVLE